MKLSEPKVLVTFEDPACDGQCDSYGENCVFPTYVCGQQSCDIATNMLSPQACNGAGKCAGYAPAPCPGNLTCADAERCRTSCSASTDCVAGYTCNGSDCVPAN